MSLEPFYNLRRKIVDRLLVDIIGPESDYETIGDAPITKYAAGILYPTSSRTIHPVEHIDDADDADNSAAADPAVSLDNTRYPSSMGMTFAVTDGTPMIRVTVSCGQYFPLQDEVADASPDAESELAAAPSRARQHVNRGWQRSPIGPMGFPIDISSPTSGAEERVIDGLTLFYRVRRPVNGAVPVTVALVNRNIAKFGERDQAAFFQPTITVTGSPAGDAIFVERQARDIWSGDADIRSNRLIYRHARPFAIGHGCSVTWEPVTDAKTVHEIRSTFQPEYDLHLADSNPAIVSPAFGMRRLGFDQDKEAILNELREFVAGYRAWIEHDQTAGLAAIPDDLLDVGRDNLERCRTAADRMEGGIEALSSDDMAWEAFRLANQAMLQQRARSDWLRNGKVEDKPDLGVTQAWRPFQLAFILQCVRGIASPVSDDRKIADLLWFPTGGGKTEAYLGLIAFTTFLRRLRSQTDEGGGVTTIMRYTLRLLTTQQFERAAMLICACEDIRRTYNRSEAGDRRHKLGSQPISVGLWVGQDATPNSRSDAARALDKLRNGARLEKGNPVQLHACPWCGSGLDANRYAISGDKSRLVIACRTDGCTFRDGLPVFVVDDDLYDHRPSLIIATVDKFASLPWREATASLFNIDDPEPPPELIIQDELHLISGPLGTLTGLYETAVELLSTNAGIPPKIIASTATIRRADHQTSGLFARPDLHQFPPPALDARDSYFAVETPPEDKGSRLYVGLMAPGTSHTTLMVRTYASLLQSVTEFGADDQTRDPYWTLVGFFNSLRVLGGARMQVQDDVGDRVALLARDRGTQPRVYEKRIELTSRESSADIPARLREMAISLPDENVTDLILATNMISVGVDVDRLGLMVVMGQPPSSSEYIQATSRVGRRYPGLVVTLFNASRSRDRSHYEAFTGSHSALYRQVEATSVTPFSARARNRGLHAVVVALARLLIPEFRSNGGASAILQHTDKLAIVRDIIEDRVSRVNPEATDETLREYDELIGAWKRRAVDVPGLVYQNRKQPEIALLVDASAENAAEADGWETAWSLRDVDMTSNLYVVR